MTAKIGCSAHTFNEWVKKTADCPVNLYYEVITKRTDVDRLSVHARRDLVIKVEIRRVFDENFKVYGVCV